MGKTDHILRPYLKAGYPLLYLVTTNYEHILGQITEEVLGISGVKDAAEMMVWKPSQVSTASIKVWGTEPDFSPNFVYADLGESLDRFTANDDMVLGVFFNVRGFLFNDAVIQKLLDAAYTCKLRGSHLILVGVRPEIPPELRSVLTLIDIPLPDRDQLMRVFAAITLQYKDDIIDVDTTWGVVMKKNKGKFTDQQKAILRDAARASLGLDQFAAENAFCLSIAQTRTIDIKTLQAQKEDEIRKSDVLEFVNTSDGLSSVGGFAAMKEWLTRRRTAFSDEARQYGLPYPKGILLVGYGGTGKSLAAKSISSFVGLPLIRLDMGRVFRSLVGESEAAMRSALQVIEAVSPVVVWLDELDRAFAGSQSSGQTDSGVTSRVIGTILTWRAETAKPVMMVATANDIRSLPSMIYRRGRFDEVWYVDLPTETERAEIFSIHIAKRGRDPENYAIRGLAARTQNFVGAEIEAVIEDAMFTAFADGGREFTNKDVVQAIADTIPSATRDREELDSLREWAATRARSVSGPKKDKLSPGKVRKLRTSKGAESDG